MIEIYFVKEIEEKEKNIAYQRPMDLTETDTTKILFCKGDLSFSTRCNSVQSCL